MRFTSSGTEATLLALRVARGFTAATACSSWPGHFHGWHDDASPGVAPPSSAGRRTGSPPNGVLDRRRPVRRGRALERELAPRRRRLRDPRADRRRLGRGAAAARARRVDRAAARAAGTLLVFDEVVTGFRWSPGGAQARDRRHARPDGAREGRRRRPARRRPHRARGRHGGARLPRGRARKVEHPGTHNAHPLAAAAGIATLDLLADGIGARARTPSRPSSATALCSAFEQRSHARATHTAQARRSASSSASAPTIPVTLKLRRRRSRSPSALQCAMLLEGVQLFHGCGLLSTAHGDDEVELHRAKPSPRAGPPAGRGPDPVTTIS